MRQAETAVRGRVWVVDDIALERDIIQRALARSFDVRAFGDGGAMLEAFSSERRPDLLMLDWQMPDMSGREVCVFVRETTNGAQLPIVVLTASGEDLVEALEVGANDYVSKPFRAEELNARVKTLVSLHREHESLVEAEQQLRIEATFRERFVGILAHDLRQPLNIITMTLSVLKDVPGIGQATHARATRAALRMNRMIDELLDFTRSRIGGGMPVRLVEGDLAEIVARAVQDRTDRDFVDLVTEGNTRGTWDADRMTQVCGNLIGNAIDYGAPDGRVSVRVAGSAGEVVFEVHNDGPPIPAEDLSTLFDPFRRGSIPKPGKESGPGLGLGLFIVDQIIRAHEGTLNVRSGQGGTTFVARLPRNTPTGGAPGP